MQKKTPKTNDSVYMEIFLKVISSSSKDVRETQNHWRFNY